LQLYAFSLNATNSDIIVEARSVALSIDNSTFQVGIPSIGAPIPLTGATQTPELAAYKSQKQRSVAKIALLAFARVSRAHIYSSGPLDGSSHNNHYNVFLVSWTNTDIPEKTAEKRWNIIRLGFHNMIRRTSPPQTLQR
jgi:hypothetical protein